MCFFQYRKGLLVCIICDLFISNFYLFWICSCWHYFISFTMTNLFVNLVDVWCRNLPFDERATRDSWVRLPRKENVWSHHQRLLEKNIRKNWNMGLWTLSMKSSGVVFTHGEGIKHPTHLSQGMTTFKSNVQNHDFHFIWSSLFYVFYFLGSTKTRLLLLRILNYDVELRHT